MGCAFCNIVSGKSPARKVYEDDDVMAFLDIRPVTKGHTLVIPKRHSTVLDDLDHELGNKVFQVSHMLARAVRRSPLQADGANLLINDGPAAFQTVHHVHMHVIPRAKGDLFKFGAGFLLRRSFKPDAVADAVRAGVQRLHAEGEDVPL